MPAFFNKYTMPQLPADIVNKIKATAKILPVILSNTHEKHILSGAEIIELGTIEKIDGKAIVHERKYVMPMPVQLYWNHFRRLKKAYSKEGYIGVKRYVALVESIYKSQNN